MCSNPALVEALGTKLQAQGTKQEQNLLDPIHKIELFTRQRGRSVGGPLGSTGGPLGSVGTAESILPPHELMHCQDRIAARGGGRGWVERLAPVLPLKHPRHATEKAGMLVTRPFVYMPPWRGCRSGCTGP